MGATSWKFESSRPHSWHGEDGRPGAPPLDLAFTELTNTARIESQLLFFQDLGHWQPRRLEPGHQLANQLNVRRLVVALGRMDDNLVDARPGAFKRPGGLAAG